MAHKVNHRGPAPGDEQLFGPDALPLLRGAASDLGWLLNRGYAQGSALELVGNRYALRDRQRLAVGRCACSDTALERRRQHGLAPSAMRGRALWLDGYNVLMAMEAALGGGVVLVGRDGCCRDVLGIHGSYHRVHETEPALRLIAGTTADLGVGQCHWWLDRPVSNSGRLKALILDLAQREGWDWTVDLVMNPDRVLVETQEVVATADSYILDYCARWFNLVRLAISSGVPGARVVDLSAA
ncbi:MAG: DUF434 domain-containing protein [Verrucomicrobia bacterium]|nr:DUF434 domain-containing protein [Verrucomicrobiota bacterium]